MRHGRFEIMRFSIRLYLIVGIALFAFQKGISQNATTLVINELMINPNNVATLPTFEYIELYNNSEKTIDLSTVTLFVNNNQQILPTYLLAPSQYIILCSEESANQFARYGNVLPLTRWYALNNSGAHIQLSHDNTVIDDVSYQLSWYNSTTKRNGGWSLERINPDWTCNLPNNWSATNAPNGGTPGKVNSIVDFNHYLHLQIEKYTISGNEIEIKFNVPALYFVNPIPSNFNIDNGLGIPKEVQITNDALKLIFNEDIEKQKILSLYISDIHLCNVYLSSLAFKLFNQPTISKNDIVINEILFNPKESGVDFVELYNRSEYPINLQDFKLGNQIITNQFLLLESNDYIALTTNKAKVIEHYPNTVADKTFEVKAMPSYTNQQGIVTLFSNYNILIDSIYYNANMHSSLLINVKGISLERSHPDKNSFYSAATLIGGATPGYQNSTLENQEIKNEFFLTSKTISPNGDEYEDELEMNYMLNKPNYLITLRIFNETGQLVKTIANKKHAGTSGQIYWGGRNEQNQLCKNGHYIVLAEIFNEDGVQMKFKQPFVLIHANKNN